MGCINFVRSRLVHHHKFLDPFPGGQFLGFFPARVDSKQGVYLQHGLEHYEGVDAKVCVWWQPSSRLGLDARVFGWQRRIQTLLAACGALKLLHAIEPRHATEDELAAVHTREHIAKASK
jgi:hypothetical protein